MSPSAAIARFLLTALLSVVLAIMAPTPAPAAAIPSELRALHVLNRVAYGPRPGDIARVNEIGVERYIEEQLHPESIPVPQAITQQMREYETLFFTPPQLFVSYGPKPGVNRKIDPMAAMRQVQLARLVLEQGFAARFYRAIEGPRQLKEVLVDFWFNHFNVFAHKGLDRIWVASFEEEAIRPHVLGRFRDLLGATARHPAMLFYLDNWLNTAPGSPGAKGRFEGLNENYARELMELHTLGVDGGYTQKDVTELARILTGWGLAHRRPGGAMSGAGGRRAMLRAMSVAPAGSARDPLGFYFDPGRHDFNAKIFLGHTITGSGIAEGEQAMDILARSPATARHISYELARYFVADDPPGGLVDRLTSSYLRSDGDIRAVLEVLFHAPEFWDQRYYANKFKTPYQFVVSAMRATALAPRNFRPLMGELTQLGEPLYGCQTPDGYKDTQEAWLNPDAMMRRLSFATALGSGHLPVSRPIAFRFDDAAMTGAHEPAAGAGSGLAPAPDPDQLAETLGNRFSQSTVTAVREAPVQLRSSLILASPEFMRR